MSWAKDLVKLCQKGGHDMGELSKALKIELFTGVVQDTRVRTGRLRGNWQIHENEPAKATLYRLDPTGQKVAQDIAKHATANGVTYFTNNLPYAVVFEEKDGMVGRNAARVQQNVKKMAKAL